MANDRSLRRYLVECYWPGVDDEKLADAAQRVELATKSRRRDGSKIVYLGAVLMPGDETVFCLFRGTEADVRAVSTTAGLPFERVVESRWLEGQLTAWNGLTREEMP